MGGVGDFEVETSVELVAPGEWRAEYGDRWNIGASANGGYALTPVLRALHQLGGHTDPISVTTHFLRPVQIASGELQQAEIHAELIRTGRTTSVARGSLTIDDRERLTVMAAFGELDTGGSTGDDDDADDAVGISMLSPDLPPPDDCIDRRELNQGVDLPILDRLEVRIDPNRVTADPSGGAVMEGWIRLRDGDDPSTMSLPLFADAFPPSLFSKFGQVGWVPTVELTVHVRRRPAPGWIQARFECDDLIDGRMIESGALWDSNGELVARSRQLGLLLT
jgi:acyl-CoA thioesterase